MVVSTISYVDLHPSSMDVHPRNLGKILGWNSDPDRDECIPN